MSKPEAIQIETILTHLRALVSADSSEPERTMTANHPAMLYAMGVLTDAGCDVEITDLGGGCVNLFATRGETRTLFNCHLDTVKPNPMWTRDPFALDVEQGLAYGLGACDIKGAAACMLAVAQSTDAPIAIFLSSDEEGGKGVCVDSFLGAHAGRFARVVVAEPTNAKAVFQHRGFASFEIDFSGTAGHTSGADASSESAIHKAIKWGSEALELARPGGVLDGSRFNIGVIEGGTASNVIAASAKVRFGFRPQPSPEANELAQQGIDALRTLLPKGGGDAWSERFVGPALSRDDSMIEVVESWGIELGADVDFWTEAALFSAAGLPAIVLGPGDIAQAHASDEFVALDQLEKCAGAYMRIVGCALQTPMMTGGTHAP